MNEFLLKLSKADISTLARALQDMPYRLAAPLIDKINAQLAAQQEPQQRPQHEPDR